MFDAAPTIPNYLEEAQQYRLALKVNPSEYDAMLKLAKLIHIGHVQAEAEDFVDNCVPPYRSLQTAKLCRYILKQNPRHSDARFLLASLIVHNPRNPITRALFRSDQDAEVIVESEDFHDGIVPTDEDDGRYAQAAKLFCTIIKYDPKHADALYMLSRLIQLNNLFGLGIQSGFQSGRRRSEAQAAHFCRLALKSNPYHSDARSRLAHLIVSCSINAKAEDFPDGVVPAERCEQALKLIRYGLLLNNNEAFKDFILGILELDLKNSNVKYQAAMALNYNLDDMKKLINEDPNAFTRSLHEDCFLTQVQKNPYYQYIQEKFGSALTPRGRAILQVQLGHFANLKQDNYSFFSRVPNDVVGLVEKFVQNSPDKSWDVPQPPGVIQTVTTTLTDLYRRMF